MDAAEVLSMSDVWVIVGVTFGVGLLNTFLWCGASWLMAMFREIAHGSAPHGDD